MAAKIASEEAGPLNSPDNKQPRNSPGGHRRHPPDGGNKFYNVFPISTSQLLWASLLILTIAISLASFMQRGNKKESLKPHENHLLGQSINGYKEASTKLTNMQQSVNPNQQLFLKGLKTSVDVSVSQNIRKDEYLDYLDQTFLSGDWSKENQATMRRLRYETNSKTTRELKCTLDGVQECSLSKLQVMARHYKDKEEDNKLVDKMNVFYSLSTVNFSVAQFKEVAEKDEQGMFWNAAGWLAGRDQKSKEKTKQELVPMEEIELEALGHFFLDYTQNDIDRLFYKQVINVIDPYGKHYSLTDESKKDKEENF